jgi:hypothetical protein
MGSRTGRRRRGAANAKPLSARKKVRAQGMRPVTLWVRSPKFAADAKLQCLLANRSPYSAEDWAWVYSMAEEAPFNAR